MCNAPLVLRKLVKPYGSNTVTHAPTSSLRLSSQTQEAYTRLCRSEANAS